MPSRSSPVRRSAAAGPAELKPLDDMDWRVLRLLQNDARVSTAELARQVELSPPGLQKRLRKLEESGVIERYVTLVNRESVGLDLLCFVHVTLAHHEPEYVSRFRDAMKLFPEVLECHHLTGEFDYLLKVVVENHKHLERFLVEKITRIPGVDRVRTSIVLREIKTSTALPLE
ncbi:MAG: Lrp/AsnC family transcriptional regulator [Planctomycetota bacterium]|nr:Lrp/AsnC family transcriptional regulator [Planctomycetota bacterium]